VSRLKLGLQLGYWGAGPPTDAGPLVAEAERLGYDSVFTAEAYGSDALSPLAWWGSRTTRVRLGTALCQLSARTPTATAMAALTLDHLSGGRFVLGLGVSGPQVVEGWYGQPFPKPLERTREYVSIVRQVLARQHPVTNEGPHYPLPYPGGTGLGKPLKSIVHPLRADIPILLGAEGPKNVALAAEVADGWFPAFFSPSLMGEFSRSLAEGFARPGARRSAEDFEVIASCPVVVDADPKRAAEAVKPLLALYIGGMGAREMNFHFEVFARLGFAEAAAQVQDLYLEGHKAEAIAAVPTSMVDKIALVGPLGKIRDDVAAWQQSLATTLLVWPLTGPAGTGTSALGTVRAMAEVLETSA
jgi:F420-dependent oxidoreductase-like protein